VYEEERGGAPRGGGGKEFKYFSINFFFKTISENEDAFSTDFSPPSMDSGKVPLPTLYNGSGSGHDPSGSGSSDPRRPRLGAIEMLLYNMSSMLASVAAGYDVVRLGLFFRVRLSLLLRLGEVGSIFYFLGLG
jgi:hypothetical protein